MTVHEMGSYKCAKLYTSATTGYYIMCSNYTTAASLGSDGEHFTWSEACAISVSAGGQTFVCGSKAQWEAIMSACGGTGYYRINAKCQGVSNWNEMAGTRGYWTSTIANEVDSTLAWAFASDWYTNSRSGGNYKEQVRLIAPFSE